VVLEGEEEFDIWLEGFQDNDSRPCLRLRVNGTIRLACQRCLEPLSIELASDRHFVLVEREDQLMDLADENDNVESLMAEEKFDVMVLVEDEILLQVPIAPTHDPHESRRRIIRTHVMPRIGRRKARLATALSVYWAR